jgi:phosphate:Na+ symporter
MISEMILAVIPAVILFLYGIENFSEEVRHVAGERFRIILQKATETSLRGALAGAAVTGIIQSSTATTIIVIGLVNAGAISFLGSLGLIIGANVGTTLTAQLVAFKLTAFAPAFLIFGFIAAMIRGPYRALGKPIFYFGLVFYSLNLISNIVSPLQQDADVLSLLSMTDNVLTAIIIGFIITNIFQSSSVTAGLIVVIAQSNLITVVQAIPVILGANIGTTITGLIVSLRMNAAARRTALAQFFFNSLGVLLFLPLLDPFSRMIYNLGGTEAQQVANAHLIFNATCAIFFLLVINPFSRLILRLIPSRDGEIVFLTRHIRPTLPDDIPEATRLVEREIVHMLDIAKDIFLSALQVAAGRMDLCSKIVQSRDYVDYLHSQIISAIVSLSDRDISVENATRLAILARVADLCGLMVLQMVSMARKFESMKDKKMELSEESYAGIQEMAIPCQENMDHLIRSFPDMPEDIDRKMRYNDERLRLILNWNYKLYLIRLASKSSYSAMFSEIIFSFERIGSIIRELRKTSISMSLPSSALNMPDLIKPPDHDEEG